MWRVESEEGLPLRLKVEINSREHFTVLGCQPFKAINSMSWTLLFIIKVLSVWSNDSGSIGHLLQDVMVFGAQVPERLRYAHIFSRRCPKPFGVFIHVTQFKSYWGVICPRR